jgi:hypothetical protein
MAVSRLQGYITDLTNNGIEKEKMRKQRLIATTGRP